METKYGKRADRLLAEIVRQGGFCYTGATATAKKLQLAGLIRTLDHHVVSYGAMGRNGRSQCLAQLTSAGAAFLQDAGVCVDHMTISSEG